MDLDRIKTFIDAMAATDLATMTFSEGGWTLRLSRGAAGAADPVPAMPKPVAAPPAPPRKPAAAAPVRAPMAGIVHLRPAPDKPDFVAPGASIAAGAVVCVVEAMKTFLQVRAERGGLVDAILVASGDEVELGQPLMRIG